ncbi:MAG: 3-deoxy-7-phosphoheptulonate synthase, partial [Desulfobacteraceae bacterium]
MLVVMEKTATEEEISEVIKVIAERGFTARPIPGGDRVSIGVLNNRGSVDPSMFTGLPGVKEAVPITKPYKLVSREFQSQGTIVRVGDVSIGNGHLTIMAGPCAVES